MMETVSRKVEVNEEEMSQQWLESNDMATVEIQSTIELAAISKSGVAADGIADAACPEIFLRSSSATVVTNAVDAMARITDKNIQDEDEEQVQLGETTMEDVHRQHETATSLMQSTLRDLHMHQLRLLLRRLGHPCDFLSDDLPSLLHAARRVRTQCYLVLQRRHLPASFKGLHEQMNRGLESQSKKPQPSSKQEQHQDSSLPFVSASTTDRTLYFQELSDNQHKLILEQFDTLINALDDDATEGSIAELSEDNEYARHQQPYDSNSQITMENNQALQR